MKKHWIKQYMARSVKKSPLFLIIRLKKELFETLVVKQKNFKDVNTFHIALTQWSVVMFPSICFRSSSMSGLKPASLVEWCQDWTINMKQAVFRLVRRADNQTLSCCVSVLWWEMWLSSEEKFNKSIVCSKTLNWKSAERSNKLPIWFIFWSNTVLRCFNEVSKLRLSSLKIYI